MKKLLALILAVLMIASVAITMISAETKINVEEVCTDYANAKRYIGPAIETAPVLDGVISEDEYTWSLTGQKIVDHANATDENKDDSYTNFIGEYAAYDADWVYYATTVVQYGNVTTPRMEIRMSYDYLIGTELKTFSVGRDIEDDLGMAFEGGIFNVVPTGVTAPSEEQYAFKTGVDGGYVTFEFKISRAYLAEQMGLESAADYKKFTYFTYLGWTYFNCVDGTWSYIYTDYYMTEADRAALADAGVTTPLVDSTDATAGAAKLFSMLMLGEEGDDFSTSTSTTTVTTTGGDHDCTTTAKPTEATTTAAPATTTAAATTAAATTTAKAADATTTAAAEEKGGCGSTLAISALAMIPTLAGGVILTSKKRKED